MTMQTATVSRRRNSTGGAGGKHTWVTLFAVLFVLVSALAPQTASAHGGGPVRAIWDDASGFYMVIETNEDPAAGFLGGVVHVTMIPTASEGSTVRLRGLDISVSAVGPEGKTAGPIRGKQKFNGPYEADLMVSKPGVWRIWIEVDNGTTVQQFQFPLEVVARSVWTDLLIVGGLMAVPILGIAGMARLRRSRNRRTGGAARASHARGDHATARA